MAVGRDPCAAGDVDDLDPLGHRQADALAGLDIGLLGEGQPVPFVAPPALGDVTERLRQAVDLDHIEAKRPRLLEDRRRRSARRHHLDRSVV
jgi:hypothetical protein